MHANYLDTLDWGILIAYFLILIGIGIWASLKRKKGSSLFLAERLNPEKPDVPLNKNDAFQKVQKRRVQEKR